MKTLRFFFVMAAMFLAASNADAQNTMRVHQKDGTIHKFSITDVDFVDWCDEEAPEGEGTDPKFEDIEINGTTYHLGISGAIDLGIRVKWAAYNVGAEAPEEYGDYFAWGETEPYYTEGHAQDDPCNYWKDGKSKGYGWPSYKWCNGTYNSLTKYCMESSYGTVDNKTTLELADDAAHVNWGGDWRMPTDAEREKLCIMCSWIWTSQGGVNGYVVTGPNGNSIFLPAAGYRDNSSRSSAGSNGYYWSSSLNSSYSDSAYGFFFYSDDVGWCDGGPRYFGRSVRPVCP